MSDIAQRLITDHALNPTVFGALAIMFIEDVYSAAQIRDVANAHIAENQIWNAPTPPLTAQEEADIQTMKTHYNTHNINNKAIFRDLLPGASELLREGNYPESEWDTRFLGI